MAGRPCTICGHVNRLEIERALESGESLRAVAARFELSRSGLHRHNTSHLPAQRLDTPCVAPVMLFPPPPVTQPPDPERPNELAMLSGQPKAETPAQPAVLEERPAPPKNDDGKPTRCPICGSKNWRQLDGHLTCDVCHPLPPFTGTFMHTGQTVSDPRGAATPIRVPIALS